MWLLPWFREASYLIMCEMASASLIGKWHSIFLESVQSHQPFLHYCNLELILLSPLHFPIHSFHQMLPQHGTISTVSALAPWAFPDVPGDLSRSSSLLLSFLAPLAVEEV